MKSNVYLIKHGFVREQIFREVEKSAQYFDLPSKTQLQLRLLTEELTGMLYAIAGKYRGEFWVEAEPVEYVVRYWENVHTVDFKLHLRLEADLDAEGRKQLLSVASSGRNEPPAGIMGKIQAFLELCSSETEAQNCPAGMNDMYAASITGEGTLIWSLRNYTEVVSGKKQSEEWDELEKSIIANLADDVTVRIRGRRVEVVVSKSVTVPKQ